MNKTVILMRAVSGSGKTTLTNLLTKNVGYVSVSADHYFTDAEGNYKFDGSKIGEAHAACQKQFVEALKESTVDVVIVDNTNTSDREIKIYQELAAKYDAQFISLVVENRHGGMNQHNVPDASLDRQENNIKQSLKLR